MRNTPLVARLFNVHWIDANLLFLNDFSPWCDRLGNMTHGLDLLMMRADIVLFFMQVLLRNRLTHQLHFLKNVDGNYPEPHINSFRCVCSIWW